MRIPPIGILLALLGALSGCASTDPCAGASGACLALTLDAPAGQTADMLLLQITSNAGFTPQMTTPPGGGATGFPLAFALLLGKDAGSVIVGVTAELHGQPVLYGVGQTVVSTGQHASLTIALSPGSLLDMSGDMAPDLLDLSMPDLEPQPDIGTEDLLPPKG